jgi:tetratricopeptide (TPR) repeat protein
MEMLKKICLLLMVLALFPWISHADMQTDYRSVGQSFEMNRPQNVMRAAYIPQDAHKTVPRKSNLADVFYHQGNTYIRVSQYEKAIEYYNQAIYLNPRLADAYYNRGNAYSYIGRYQRAEVDYSRVISLKPDFLNAYHNRGLVHLFLKNFEYACSDFVTACDLGDCSALRWAKDKGVCR